MSVRYRGIRALGLIDPAERGNLKRMDRTLRDLVSQITRITQRQQTLLQQISSDPGLVRYGDLVNRPQPKILYQHAVQFMLYFAIDTDQLFAWDGLIWVEIGSGRDAIDLAFFDDFIADPLSFPFGGASGTWNGGSSGAGASLTTDTSLADTSGVGVWRLQSGTTVGATHTTLSPNDSTTFPLSLVPGLKIGCRVRVDSANFTRGHLMVGLSNMDLTTSAINDGSECLNFGIWVADVGYPLNADPEQDTLYFRAQHAGSDQIYKYSQGSGVTKFLNFEMHVTDEQRVHCFQEGNEVTILVGGAVPPSSQALSLRIRMETRGSINPAANQQSYIDRVWIDTTDVERGVLFGR